MENKKCFGVLLPKRPENRPLSCRCVTMSVECFLSNTDERGQLKDYEDMVDLPYLHEVGNSRAFDSLRPNKTHGGSRRVWG